MFSTQQKRQISNQIQRILRDTNHPELPPEGEIRFQIHIEGAEPWSWADIENNGAIKSPSINPWDKLSGSDQKH